MVICRYSKIKKLSACFFAILFVVWFFNTPLAVAQTDSGSNNTPSFQGLTTETTQRNYQRIIPLTSPVYRELDRLYLLAGKARPSLSRPWSADEAKKIMEELPENFLDSVPDSVIIIKREIGFGNENTGPQKMAFKVSPEINIEGHVKTNNNRKEWEHGYEERPPLINIPLELWLFPNWYMNVEFAQKQDHAIVNKTNNYVNLSLSPREYDWSTPFRAFMSVGGERWNVQAGRDKISWGAGVTGNMMVSDYSDFYNLVRLTTYWNRFKFTAVYMGFEPWLTDQEIEYGIANNGLGGPYTDFEELFKAHLGKRIEIRILDNLSFAITETSMFGNKHINITELNPIMYYHNLFTPEYSNVMMGFDVDYTPFSGLNIYLQYAIDEFSDADPGGEGKPRAMGYLGGFTYIRQAFDGFMTFNLEAALTDPYLYNRWHPNTRFTNRRRIERYDWVNKPIGYRHGPDAVIINGAVQYEKPGRYMAGISVRYSLLGEMNDSLDYAGSYDIRNGINRRLSGTVERNRVTRCHGTIQITDRISVASDIYYVRIDNYQNLRSNTINDLEVATSVRFKL